MLKFPKPIADLLGSKSEPSRCLKFSILPIEHEQEVIYTELPKKHLDQMCASYNVPNDMREGWWERVKVIEMNKFSDQELVNLRFWVQDARCYTTFLPQKFLEEFKDDHKAVLGSTIVRNALDVDGSVPTTFIHVKE